MKRDVQQQRQWAVKRVFDGEHIDSICVSLGRSRAWLYKWVERSLQDEPVWYKSQSRRPHNSPLHTSEEIEEIVKIVRLNLQILYLQAPPWLPRIADGTNQSC